MNYGKKKASRLQKELTSKATMKKKRFGVRLFKSLLILCLIVGVLGIIGGGLLFKKTIDDAPKITPENVKPSKFTTTVYANDETTVLDTFVGAGSNRIYKPIDEIPLNLQNAFIAIEDSRFREHNGIDLKGIARAGIKGILSVLSGGDFSEGASTITQQLIKNNIFPNFINEGKLDRVKRKIQEQYLAIEIEKQMDKDEILENYLNTVNLGQNTLGVQVASTRYFGKNVSELTLSECATIAAITQNPSRYNPVTNPEENAKRRKKVLDDMLEQGFIEDKAQYEEALSDPVYERIQATNTQYMDDNSASSYFVDEVSRQVMNDLCEELQYSETQAYNAVYSGGLSIITTQDVNMQQICEEELSNDENYPRNIEWGISCAITITSPDGTQTNYDHNGLQRYIENTYGDKYGLSQSSKEEAEAIIEEYIATLTQEGDTVDKRVTLSPQPQASVVVMDQYTGYVKAIVGGRGEKTESRSLNRATQSPRQPGSCFKILSTFAPALDTHGDTLATIIEDSPFKYENGRDVRNWWGNSYKGNLTIRQCIEQSANVCTVKKFTEITPALGFKYLTENFKFTTLDKQKDIYQPTALGGISKGVTNLEMTAAYASIANKGLYTEPILYTKILDHDGNVLFEKTPQTHIALKETTAALLTDAMQDVITGSRGTGRYARMSNMPVSGKTGTTTDTIDLWLSAYTPYLTASVWTGYDDNSPMQGAKINYNEHYHMVIWRKIMERIHSIYGYEYQSFEMPNSIERKTICRTTGLLASSEACPGLTEYFAPGTAPTQSCPGHILEGEGEGEDENKNQEHEGEGNEQHAENAENGNASPPAAPPEDTSGNDNT